MTATLLLVRNGETEWNTRRRFLGWGDPALTEAGVTQSARGGVLAQQAGVQPDVVHTSLLLRSIHTAEEFLRACDRSWIPVRRSWRLNERHYGALQGHPESAMRRRYGNEEVTYWRTSSVGTPPPVPDDDEFSQAHDRRYHGLPSVPRTECIADVAQRVVAYFEEDVVPDLRWGTVLVSSHGNPIRALTAYLEGADLDAMRELDVPAGVAVRYRLDEQTMKPTGPADLVGLDRWLVA